MCLHFICLQNVHYLIGRKQWVKRNVVIRPQWLSNVVISFASIKPNSYRSTALVFCVCMCVCLHLCTLYMCLDCICPQPLSSLVYYCVHDWPVCLLWVYCGQERALCLALCQKAKSQWLQQFHRLVLRQWKLQLLWQPVKPTGGHFPL